MSAADTEAVLARMVDTHNALGPEDFAAYAFMTLGMLAHQAPEVLTFLLDRADERVGR